MNSLQNLPDGHVVEECDFKGGGDVEDVVRDDDLGPCNKEGRRCQEEEISQRKGKKRLQKR